MTPKEPSRKRGMLAPIFATALVLALVTSGVIFFVTVQPVSQAKMEYAEIATEFAQTQTKLRTSIAAGQGVIDVDSSLVPDSLLLGLMGDLEQAEEVRTEAPRMPEGLDEVRQATQALKDQASVVDVVTAEVDESVGQILLQAKETLDGRIVMLERIYGLATTDDEGRDALKKALDAATGCVQIDPVKVLDCMTKANDQMSKVLKDIAAAGVDGAQPIVSAALAQIRAEELALQGGDPH